MSVAFAAPPAEPVFATTVPDASSSAKRWTRPSRTSSYTGSAAAGVATRTPTHNDAAASTARAPALLGRAGEGLVTGILLRIYGRSGCVRRAVVGLSGCRPRTEDLRERAVRVR